MVILLASIGATCSCIQFASSQASTTVKVETPSAFAVQGKAFTVTISLTNVQNLYGLEVILTWNATVLQATNINIRLGVESFSDGVLHAPIFIAENNVTQSTGEYRLVATSQGGAPPFAGSGNIVKITFNPINIGNSALSLQTQLYDFPPAGEVSLPIQHTTQDSSITVTESTNTPSPSPSPSGSTPPTPTPTAPSTSPTPTPSPTLKPQKPEVSNELILLVILLILLIAAIAFIILRKRKK